MSVTTKPAKRCRYCGEVIQAEPGPHRAYRADRAQYCGRRCYKAFLMERPPVGKGQWEPTEEEIAEIERRKAECRAAALGHLEFAGVDD